MSDQIREVQPQTNLIQFPKQFLSLDTVEEARRFLQLPSLTRLLRRREARLLVSLSMHFRLQSLSQSWATLWGKTNSRRRQYEDSFRMVNSHSTCQQCPLCIRSWYLRSGLLHDCVYCYAKAELTVHGYWTTQFLYLLILMKSERPSTKHSRRKRETNGETYYRDEFPFELVLWAIRSCGPIPNTKLLRSFLSSWSSIIIRILFSLVQTCSSWWLYEIARSKARGDPVQHVVHKWCFNSQNWTRSTISKASLDCFRGN